MQIWSLEAAIWKLHVTLSILVHHQTLYLWINLHQPRASLIRRSFVPPVRDEESETQRKAHAKRVRETRRSTQGVTLDEIKSAEQLVKKKQQQTTGTTGNDALSAGTTTVSQVDTPTITAHHHYQLRARCPR